MGDVEREEPRLAPASAPGGQRPEREAGGGIYLRIIRGDIAKSRGTTLAVALFVAAAAALVSLAAVLAVNLSGSIDTLMERAKTPHFMQMHRGPIDKARLAAFAARSAEVEDFQVLDFLNVEGARIVIGGRSLGGSGQDNGFCVQSPSFDFLLDLDDRRIAPSDGQVYAPLCYRRDGRVKVGDKALICGREFTVAGFLRDSQMNPLLASSKRFLLSEGGYARLAGSGSLEYLIEFRLKELSALGAFEAAYSRAGLEANGPTVTYPLFRMMNALSDGLMIALILLVGALVVAIAFLCIRFTLLAKIEEDYREIGVMKAIGLRLSDLRRIYLAKYAAIAAAGSALGYALSLPLKGALLENIRLTMGESGHAALAPLLGLAGVFLVFLAIVGYVSGELRRLGRIRAADALRFGGSRDRRAGAQRFRLSEARLLDANLFLGLKDVLARPRLYATMLFVLALAAFILVVPHNLYTTIAAKSFCRYLGIGSCDLRVDLQQTEDIPGKAAAIEAAMGGDRAIARFAAFTTKTFMVRPTSGPDERIMVELGDHRAFPVEYSSGRAPLTSGEIALSAINARELGKRVGDSLVLSAGGVPRRLAVCGVYSDLTNGGKTAKASFEDDSAEVMWCVLCASLAPGADAGKKAAEYARRFEYAKVSDIGRYIAQTFGSTMESVRKASIAAAAVALALSALVTLLFMRMLVAKDRYPIAVLKTCGFTNRDIAAQYFARSLAVLAAGVTLGILLANTLGQALAGLVISSFGASSFAFAIDPAGAYLACPLMMAASVLAATAAGVAGAGRVKIPENIKE